MSIFRISYFPHFYMMTLSLPAFRTEPNGVRNGAERRSERSRTAFGRERKEDEEKLEKKL